MFRQAEDQVGPSFTPILPRDVFQRNRSEKFLPAGTQTGSQIAATPATQALKVVVVDEAAGYARAFVRMFAGHPLFHAQAQPVEAGQRVHRVIVLGSWRLRRCHCYLDVEGESLKCGKPQQRLFIIVRWPLKTGERRRLFKDGGDDG